MFFFRNTSELTFSALRHARVAVTISPVVLKTLSDATDVACTQQYLTASLNRRGKNSSLAFHHNNGFSFIVACFFSRYCCSSLLLFSLAESGGSCPVIVMSSSNRDSRAVFWQVEACKSEGKTLEILN